MSEGAGGGGGGDEGQEAGVQVCGELVRSEAVCPEGERR